MRRFGGLSRSFVNLMLLLGAIGVGLWLLNFISKVSAGTPAAPIGAFATRYKTFTTTGS